MSEISAAVGDVFHAVTGKPWPRWKQLQKQREQHERALLIEHKRAVAREFKKGRRRETVT